MGADLAYSVQRGLAFTMPKLVASRTLTRVIASVSLCCPLNGMSTADGVLAASVVRVFSGDFWGDFAILHGKVAGVHHHYLLNRLIYGYLPRVDTTRQSLVVNFGGCLVAGVD